MELHFTKMHGAGNDFILIDGVNQEIDLSPEAVVYLCDRHFGIGADGLIVVRPARDEGECFMDYSNADGSIAETCGNGLRCTAKYVMDRGLVEHCAGVLAIETRAGISYAAAVELDEEGKVTKLKADMGAPILKGPEVPTTLEPTLEQGYVVDVPLSTPLGEFEVTAVSMGNPHAVVFVDDPDEVDVELIGTAIGTAPEFPEGANVGFATVDGEVIRLRVWERGVGETLACGSGAAAAHVAALVSRRGKKKMTIEVPGGELEAEWAADVHIYLTGPAREVFEGTVPVPEGDE